MKPALLHGIALLHGLALAAAPIARAAEAPPRPNLVIILADDMGYSDPGCYGGEIPTPSLDALAAGGLRFTRFYNTARCCPTRASLLTGLYPHQAGVGHMVEDRKQPGYRGDLNANTPTLAEVLRPAGYRNYAVGKWHVTPGSDAASLAKPRNWPRQRGFDRFYGTIGGGGNYFDPSSLVRDDRLITIHSDPEYRPDSFYYTDAISDQARRFIREHHRDHPQAPFLLYVAYTAPHWPLHAREADIAGFKGRYDVGWERIREARLARQKQLGVIPADLAPAPLKADWETQPRKEWEARCMEVYAAQVAAMDRGIGLITTELRTHGLLDNTLVLYLHDNGGCAEPMERDRKPGPKTSMGPVLAADAPMFGSTPRHTRDGRPVRRGRGVMPGADDTHLAYGPAWSAVSNTPFREHKHWVHEGGIATPLIAHWPAGIREAGGLRHQPGHLIDLMATCIELSGATFPERFADAATVPPEGLSLVPVFANRTRDRGFLYWEHEGNRAVSDERWKLVAKGPAGPWELYDLKADRGEQHDLAADQPDRVRAMATAWETWARRCKVLPWIWKPAYQGTTSTPTDP